MIQTAIKGIDLVFETSEGVFSPRSVDRGTLDMLEKVEFEGLDKILDLGCGYGVVGILAAKIIGPARVVMVDNDPEAVRLSRENAALNHVPDIDIRLSDGLNDTTQTNFTKILVNPPFHADFSVPKQFIHKGFNRLTVHGRFYLVTKRETWYRNKLISIFGGVTVWPVDGYYVFMSIKKRASYTSARKIKKS
jgi:16S rRNA (guanine1207-N2)-methyltransferase